MENELPFRYVRRVTGTFVLAILALFVAGIVLSAHTQQWCTARARFSILLPADGANGLQRGNEVQILGTLVGAVDGITVDEEGRMQAQVHILKEYFRFVRVDSLGCIRKKFEVGGDSFLEISRGQGVPLPAKNGTIGCREAPGRLDEIRDEFRQEVLPLLHQVSGALDAWTKVAADLGPTQAKVQQLLSNLDALVASLVQGQGTAGKLLTDPAVADTLQMLLAQATASMAEGQSILADLRQASAPLPALSTTIAGEVKDLPGLLRQTQQVLHETQKLVEGVQRHWIIRNYMEEPAPGGRIPPSEVRP